VPKNITVRAFKTLLARSLYGKAWVKYMRSSVVWVSASGSNLVLEDEMKDLDYFGITNGDILGFLK
jgi:uncharacterized ubiquitin-like protein YukD